MMMVFRYKQLHFVSFLALCATLVATAFFGYAQAQDVDELKFKQNQLQEKLSAISQQIKSYQGQISTVQKQAASLKNEIFIYDTQIKSTELQIEAKETEMQDVQLQIGELQKQIDRRITEIGENKAVLKQLIIELHELGDSSFVQLALGTDNFSNFLDDLEYTNNLQDKVNQIVQNIKEVKAKLESQQADLKVTYAKLEDLTEALKGTRAALADQQRQKQSLLTKTRGVEQNYQKLLTSSKSEEAALQKEMEDLDAQVRAKLGNKTVPAKKGSLAMPMKGVLTQGYGNTGFTSLGYSFHNGLDIAAPAGTPIYAAQDGTVSSCDTGEASYGNWCTVKHNITTTNGPVCLITLYAHMRQFKVRPGQTVQQGDLIGYEGNSGNTTRLLYGSDRGYHVHFSVFDCEGYGVAAGKYSKTYGAYSVPYGYTYNPKDFLP